MQKLLALANGALFVDKKGNVTYVSNERLEKIVVNEHDGRRGTDPQNEKLKALPAIDYLPGSKVNQKELNETVMSILKPFIAGEEEAKPTTTKKASKKRAKKEEVVTEA